MNSLDRKLRILFVDTWTNGTVFTNSVANELKSRDAEVMFLHFDSKFLKDSLIKHEGVYDHVQDLKEFDNSYLKAIRALAPDVIVFITMHGLLQRWCNYVAHVLNIRSVFFMHGVRFSDEVQIDSDLSLFDKIAKFGKRLGRAYYYFPIWVYFFRDAFSLSQYQDYKVFLMSFFEFYLHNSRFSRMPKFCWGVNFEKIFINTREDEDYFREFTKCDDLTCVVSGNVLSRESSIKALKLMDAADDKSVLFVSQPLVSASLLSKRDYVHAVMTAKSIVEDDLDQEFVLRPHPRDDDEVISLLSNKNVRISDHPSFEEDLASASALIGFNSAGLLSAIDLNLPLIVLKSPSNPVLHEAKTYLKCTIVDLENIDLHRDSIRNQLLLKVADFDSMEKLKLPSTIIAEGILELFGRGGQHDETI